MTPFSSQGKNCTCKKVIIVDDNKAQADLTRIVYQEQSIPMEIVHCQNGEEFLTLLSDIDHEEICYVLLDLNMPRLSGFDVLGHLSQDSKWKNLVVIVFSSSSSANDILKSYEMGAKAYVTKPLELQELDRTIHSIHNFWGNTNVKPSMN